MNQQYLKLTAYFGERQRARRRRSATRFLADSMLDLFGASDVATSVMLRGIASFGPRHVLRTDESLSLSEDPPVTIAAVDVEPKIRDLIDDVIAMINDGLVTLERARLVSRQLGPPALDDADRWDAAKLTVYVGRQERVAGTRAPYGGVRATASTRICRCLSAFSASTARPTEFGTEPSFSAATSMFR